MLNESVERRQSLVDSNRSWLPWSAFLSIAAAVDFIAPMGAAYVDSYVSGCIAYLVVGTMIAQVGLLAVWGVLGSYRVSVRWPVSLIGVFVIYGLMVAGVCVGPRHPGGLEPPKMIQSALAIPLIVLFAQSPIWLLRLLSGVQVASTRPGESPFRNNARQVRLQHLLVAVVVVAIAFGMARSALAVLVGHNSIVGAWRTWLPLLIVCGVSSLLTALVLLPCLWAGLAARGPWRKTIFVACYGELLAATPSLLLLLYGVAPFFEAILILSSLVVGMLLTLFTGLHLARWNGYCLRWSRGQTSVETGSSPFTELPGGERVVDIAQSDSPWG